MPIVNERTQRVLATTVEVANTRRTRRTGLLGRARFDFASALVLDPCWMIHTAFMRFPIDVLFVGADGRVVDVVHAVKPWRAAASLRARRVIELPAGTLERHGVEVGDSLTVC